MKILLVRHVAVGDVLFTTPFFRLLRQRHPDATVDLYSMVRGVLEPLPGFGAHIPMSEGSMRKVLARGYDLIYWFSYEHSPELHLLDGYEQVPGSGWPIALSNGPCPRRNAQPPRPAWPGCPAP